MQIIALCNHKRKSGKTMTALNLAMAFKTLNKRVLLIDLDPQSTLTKIMGHRDSNEIFTDPNGDEAVYCSIFGSLRGEYELSPVIMDSLDGFGMNLVTSTLDLAVMEFELAEKVGGEMFLSNLLTPYVTENNYDVVIIDGPSNFGSLLINALACCDTVIVPISMEDPSIMRLGALVDLIGNVREKFNSKLKFGGFLMTMVRESDDEVEVEARKKLEGIYKLRVLDSVVRFDPYFVKIALGNSNKYSYRPNGIGEGDYLELCQELLNNTGRTEGFITLSNSKRIARKLRLSDELSSKIELDDRLLRLFNDKKLDEWRKLIYLKEFLTDQTLVKLKNIVNQFNRSKRMVFVDKLPRFHSDINCTGLLSNYSNIEIPDEIPDDKIETYRLWYIENRNRSDFSISHVETWKCDPGDSILHSNSGVRDFSSVLKKIDDLYSSLISKCDNDYGFKIVFDNFGQTVESGDDNLMTKMIYGSRVAMRKNILGQLVRPTDEFGNVDLTYEMFLSHLSFIASIKRQIAELYELKFVSEGGTALEISKLIEMGFVRCALCS
jgi:chromosome partitioning protein